MGKIHKILSCMLALSIVAVATVPQMIETNERPEKESAAVLGIPALAIPLAVALTKEVAKYTLKQVIAAAVVGGAAGWILHEYVGSDIKADTEPLKAQARAYEADIINTILTRDTGSILRSIDGFSDIWEFTLAHWMRQSEITAVELWDPAEDYTDDTGSVVMALSGLMVNLAQFFENIEYGPDSSYELLADRLKMWEQNPDTYGPMKLAVRYGTTALTNNDYMDIHICNAVYNAENGKNTVWLDNRNLWIFGSGFSITATLDDGTSATYTLQKGYNDLTTLKSRDGKDFAAGYYTLPAGRSYAGSIVPAVSSTAAEVTSSAVIEMAGKNYSLAAYNDDKSINYISSTNYAFGNTYNSLDVMITQDSSTHYAVDMIELLEGYKKMIDVVKTTLEKSNVSAAAAWDVFTRAGAANILLSPSSFVPSNADLSESEMYVVTVMAMHQLAEYTAASGDILNKEDYRISPESLNVLILGDIYDAGGTLLYKDVVFSPYVWLYDQSFTASATTTMRQTALFAIWGNADHLDGSIVSSSVSNAGLLSASDGYRVDVKEIMKSGKPVSEVSLKVFSVDQWHEYEDSKGSGGWDFSNMERSSIAAAAKLLIAGAFFVISIITKRIEFLVIAMACALLALTGVIR